jgi:3-hydroxybutyryl-CoA dehydratase
MARRVTRKTPAKVPRPAGTGRLAGLLHQHVEFRKTVAESDVYLFAGITGDLHPNHVNEAYMSHTPYGRRIVHGALLVGFMSTTSTLMTQRLEIPLSHAIVSYGYDRVRFIKPVYLGDTITIDYTVVRVDEAEGKAFADVTIRNQRNDLVCAGTHILKIVENRTAPPRQ